MIFTAGSCIMKLLTAFTDFKHLLHKKKFKSKTPSMAIKLGTREQYTPYETK